jgi:hypothetical protein
MGSNLRFSKLFSILVFALLLVAPAWAQLPTPQCGTAGPSSPAVQQAVPSPVAPQVSSGDADDPLTSLLTPALVFKSIPGGCCPAGGSSNCPKVTGYRVVGCGADCGTGHAACLYLHN